VLNQISSSSISLFGKVNALTITLLLTCIITLSLFNHKHTWNKFFNKIFSLHNYKIVFTIPHVVIFLTIMMKSTIVILDIESRTPCLDCKTKLTFSIHSWNSNHGWLGHGPWQSLIWPNSKIANHPQHMGVHRGILYHLAVK